jgi:hypothetical protein
LADTFEQQPAREGHNSWKRLIKTPPYGNDRSIQAMGMEDSQAFRMYLPFWLNQYLVV